MARRFRNPWPGPSRGLREVLRWKLGLAGKYVPAYPQATAPAGVVPRTPAELAEMPPNGWRVLWLGHAGFQLSGNGVRLLIDPVLSGYCAPLPLPGFRRLAPPPCRAEDLPAVDAVLISHGHYDHCDLPTLRRLAGNPHLVVAEGHRAWLRKKVSNEIVEVPWWSSRDLGGVRITATPARHFSARGPWDRDRAHWCGWAVAGGGARLWHAGDTGPMPAFGEIGERLGPFDCGMIPLGAYAPRWFMAPVHIDPAEALQAMAESRCRFVIGMHWGTFRLSDEPPGEPPLLLADALRAAGGDPGRFVTGRVGECWRIVPPAG